MKQDGCSPTVHELQLKMNLAYPDPLFSFDKNFILLESRRKGFRGVAYFQKD